MAMSSSLTTVPHCQNMQEHPDAVLERLRLSSSSVHEPPTPLSTYISQGLAYTVGSALGRTPPSLDECLSAFVLPNKAGLTAGSRAWSKHAHRSQSDANPGDGGWWSTPSGPVPQINQKSLVLFWKVMNGATWRNLHWLPHQILVYEVRVAEGYGVRWSQDQSTVEPEGGDDAGKCDRDTQPWIFRGFVEPMMDNGHEVGWRHNDEGAKKT